MSRHATQIVTFSGIDGAGKTTQINRISSHLVDQGYSVSRVSFWDDVAFMSKVRASVSLAVLRNQPPPLRYATLRNDKNVRTWYLTFVRAIFTSSILYASALYFHSYELEIATSSSLTATYTISWPRFNPRVGWLEPIFDCW
jgi:GTPase SAR1 family protein